MSGNNDDKEKSATTKFLYAFTQSVLNADKSIRFAINTINRHKTRLKFEPKMGELTYTFRRYTRISRCLIPINNEHNQYYYLILTMDFDQNDFDKIITEKIIPLITQEKEKFKQES
jgi:hypothetical protein